MSLLQLHGDSSGFHSSVELMTFRQYDQAGAPYLVTMLDSSPVSCAHGATRFPQTRAVCDDFGQLVIVRAWQ